ncbi:hypothetical protein TNCV_3816921 [Trichonephila clavipes]|nr:hypothetical protein TNCV_3816921 [Trichonephila clavipes]
MDVRIVRLLRFLPKLQHEACYVLLEYFVCCPAIGHSSRSSRILRCQTTFNMYYRHPMIKLNATETNISWSRTGLMIVKWVIRSVMQVAVMPSTAVIPPQRKRDSSVRQYPMPFDDSCTMTIIPPGVRLV